jgi:hypothetical protein
MKRTLVATCLLALSLTGCGGGSSKPAAVKEATTPTATSEATQTESAAPITGGAVTDCLKIAQNFSKSASAFGAASTGDRAAGFKALASEMRALGDIAKTSKVKDALNTIADAYAQLGDKLKGINYTPGQGTPPAAYLDALREFSNPKFAAAGKVMEEFFAGSCKG